MTLTKQGGIDRWGIFVALISVETIKHEAESCSIELYEKGHGSDVDCSRHLILG